MISFISWFDWILAFTYLLILRHRFNCFCFLHRISYMVQSTVICIVKVLSVVIVAKQLIWEAIRNIRWQMSRNYYWYYGWRWVYLYYQVFSKYCSGERLRVLMPFKVILIDLFKFNYLHSLNFYLSSSWEKALYLILKMFIEKMLQKKKFLNQHSHPIDIP